MKKQPTIKDIYDAINPMPAMLSAKGKRLPEVQIHIEANAKTKLVMSWVKFGAEKDWERDYKVFVGAFDAMAIEAVNFINQLPDGETEKLHHFMGQLGKLIDIGNAHGIKVEYLNPLTETMKRLSENILTYRPTTTPADSRLNEVGA